MYAEAMSTLDVDDLTHAASDHSPMRRRSLHTQAAASTAPAEEKKDEKKARVGPNCFPR